jgi:hypothetical protein
MTNAINNVLQILEDPKDITDDANPNLIVLTSFDGGGINNQDIFIQNHKEALKKVITITEYEFFKKTQNEDMQAPHILVLADKVPANLKKFVKDDLEDYGENTIVLIRSFADTEDGFIPMAIDYEHSIYNSTSYFDSAPDRA